MIHAPIRYFGGKGMMLNQILEQFPAEGSYEIYIDAYGGSGVVLLNKPYTPVEIFNDLDQNIYALYSVLKDPKLFSLFHSWAEAIGFHEKMAYQSLKQLRDDKEMDIINRAWHFWYVSRLHRSGKGGMSINTIVRRSMSKSTSDFLSSVEGLPALHNRLATVIILNRDALKLIADYDQDKVFIYCDPPYHHETRGDTRYDTDVDEQHHEKLVELVLGLKQARVLISGYDHASYNPLIDAGWYKVDFYVDTVDGQNRKKTKTETLWRNYDLMDNLPLFNTGSST